MTTFKLMESAVQANALSPRNYESLGNSDAVAVPSPCRIMLDHGNYLSSPSSSRQTQTACWLASDAAASVLPAPVRISWKPNPALNSGKTPADAHRRYESPHHQPRRCRDVIKVFLRRFAVCQQHDHSQSPVPCRWQTRVVSRRAGAGLQNAGG